MTVHKSLNYLSGVGVHYSPGDNKPKKQDKDASEEIFECATFGKLLGEFENLIRLGEST